jgi:hypothetical protein
LDSFVKNLNLKLVSNFGDLMSLALETNFRLWELIRVFVTQGVTVGM